MEEGLEVKLILEGCNFNFWEIKCLFERSDDVDLHVGAGNTLAKVVDELISSCAFNRK